MIDKELLNILVCPVCKTDIELKNDKVICKQCKRQYPIREGIPIMLTDEAKVPDNK